MRRSLAKSRCDSNLSSSGQALTGRVRAGSMITSPAVQRMKPILPLSLLLAVAAPLPAADGPPARRFLDQHCVECHDAEVKKGGLDLNALKFDPANSTNFAKWVLIHDRVVNG